LVAHKFDEGIGLPPIQADARAGHVHFFGARGPGG
jgi:hypothetical protein